MPFYKFKKDEEPEGVRHRKLAFLPDEICIVETDAPIVGMTECTQEERGSLGDITGALAEWETKAVYDPTDEIDEVVNKLVALSFKYSDKVAKALKGKVDMPTTEGLLSADGKRVKLDAPEGWK